MTLIEIPLMVGEVTTKNLKELEKNWKLNIYIRW